MTLGNFLDAAFAALVEEYRKLGADLPTALAEMDLYRAGGPTERAEEVRAQGRVQEQNSARSEAAQALQNQKALSELEQMMAGVGRG